MLPGSPSFRRNSPRAAILKSALVFVVSSVVAGLSGGSTPARADASCPPPAQVDGIVTAALAAGNVPGASVAIFCGGRMWYVKGYGLRDVASRAPVDENTIFRFGSVTKEFVAVAMLQLASEGKLAITDPVARWYPGITSAGTITVADLLGQVSGYRDYYPLDYVDVEMSQPITVEEIVRRYGSFPLTAPPRTRWEYSNTNFAIAGRIVERTTGSSLQAYMKRSIFDPSKMMRTAFDEPPRADPDRSVGYNSFFGEPPHDEPFEAPAWLNGAAALAGTASDLVRFDVALMHHAILDESSFGRMMTEGVAGGTPTGDGLGVSVDMLNGHRIAGHGGNVIGFASYDLMAPDDDVAVAVLTNSYEAPAGAIASRLLRTMLTAPPAVATVAPTLVGAVAAPSPTPVPPAGEDEFRGWIAHLQAGRPDYAQMTPDFRRFMDAAMVPRARDALEPLGVPQSVAIGGRSERGGFVVTGGAIRFATRSVYAVMFQAPDGRVAEFLLFPILQ